MSSTNAALAWAAEQTATFYSLLASKLKDAGEDVPAGSLFEGVHGMPLALAGAGDEGSGGEGSKKGGKRGKKAKADKPKRAPSAYNVFVLQESAKLKAAGFKSDKEHSALFGMVWRGVWCNDVKPTNEKKPSPDASPLLSLFRRAMSSFMRRVPPSDPRSTLRDGKEGRFVPGRRLTERAMDRILSLFFPRSEGEGAVAVFFIFSLSLSHTHTHTHTHSPLPLSLSSSSSVLSSPRTKKTNSKNTQTS